MLKYGLWWLTEQDMPVAYEILPLAEPKIGFCVRVTLDFYNHLANTAKAEAPVITRYIANFGFEAFISPTQEVWGFGPVMKRLNSDEQDWVIWECPLPDYTENTDERWRRLRAVSATLNLIFTVAELLEYDTLPEGKTLQLLTCKSLVVSKDWPAGGSLSLAISPALCRWLSTQPETMDRRDVAEAMIRAYVYLTSKPIADVLRHSFQVLVRGPKWLNLSCPGNACGLDPKDYHNQSLERGYELLPHNVDSPIQQLTLLYGMATVYQLARADGF